MSESNISVNANVSRCKHNGANPEFSNVKLCEIDNVTPHIHSGITEVPNVNLLCQVFNVTESVDKNNVDLSHLLDEELRHHVLKLVSEYRPKKCLSTKLKMSLVLKDDIPVTQPPRRLGLPEKKIVEEQIAQWLKDGVIQKSFSDYCSPIVLVNKKDGSKRLCIDYRQLNAKTIKDRYPLPIIQDIFDQLATGTVFTTLDLKNAYFHIDMHESSTKFTAFATPQGLYEFLRVPFGLSNSPSIFQRYIHSIFQDLIHEGILIVYLDDIIIPSTTVHEGVVRLERVLDVASKYGLDLNLKKCKFLQTKIEFLGHNIENGTIKPSVEKTIAVQNYPMPKTPKQLQSFLGLTGYFRKFIQNYSQIAKPLSDLLRKNTKFHFGPSQEHAFCQLKLALLNEPVLHLFRQGSTLELHTDASKSGYGAILLQLGEDNALHPISFMSRKTSLQEEKYSSYELEVLAVIKALTKFRTYLLGSRFKIITDCAAFKQTMSKKELFPKIARWALFLEDYDYEIIHRAGTQMQHVDALSRYPVMNITLQDDSLTAKIIKAQATDEYIQTLITLCNNAKTTEFIVKNGILFKVKDDRDLLVIPEKMQTEVVQISHLPGHFASAKTDQILQQNYYFPHQRKRIETVLANCIDCILVNKKRGKSEGFLHPIPKEDLPLSTYHIDFIGPLQSTNKNYNHIFTVVDAFSKFTWLYPVKSTTAQEAISKLRNQQTIFGNPHRIIADKGPAFTSRDFAEYCTEENITLIHITTGIPRGNGQVERVHASLIPILSKLSIENPSKWYSHVPALQRLLNATAPRSTKITPFELLVGVTMRNKTDKQILELLHEEHEKAIINKREAYRTEARKNILQIQAENKRTYDKKRKPATQYQPGDLVAIQRTQFAGGLKLRPKFHGPYRIAKVKQNERYDVQKVGDHEGPNHTSTAADHMKPWFAVN